MVAKSFQSMEMITEPYVVNGRQYVKVRNSKTGAERQVRWYSDAEYAKMYPDEVKNHSKDKFFKTQKEVLGFTHGYITIFKGNTYDQKEWFKAHGARYARFWGWYILSTLEVPAELPDGIEAIRLDWDLVGTDKEVLKPDDQVQKAVESILYETQGEFIGDVGDRLELWVTVEKSIELDGYYGRSTMHVMYDDDGNTYVWTTGSKSWSEGTEHHIMGTVKDHKTYKGIQQTILTRCKEV